MVSAELDTKAVDAVDVEAAEVAVTTVTAVLDLGTS